MKVVSPQHIEDVKTEYAVHTKELIVNSKIVNNMFKKYGGLRAKIIGKNILRFISDSSRGISIEEDLDNVFIGKQHFIGDGYRNLDELISNDYSSREYINELKKKIDNMGERIRKETGMGYKYGENYVVNEEGFYKIQNYLKNRMNPFNTPLVYDVELDYKTRKEECGKELPVTINNGVFIVGPVDLKPKKFF